MIAQPGIVQQRLQIRRTESIKSFLADGQVFGQLVAAKFLVRRAGGCPFGGYRLNSFCLFCGPPLGHFGPEIGHFLRFLLRQIEFAGKSLELTERYGVKGHAIGCLEFVLLGCGVVVNQLVGCGFVFRCFRDGFRRTCRSCCLVRCRFGLVGELLNCASVCCSQGCYICWRARRGGRRGLCAVSHHGRRAAASGNRVCILKSIFAETHSFASFIICGYNSAQ